MKEIITQLKILIKKYDMRIKNLRDSDFNDHYLNPEQVKFNRRVVVLWKEVIHDLEDAIRRSSEE